MSEAVADRDSCVVTLRFSDSLRKSINVKRSDTVLEAALRVGVPLMHQCKSGSCGTCIGRVTSGSLSLDATTGHCLLPSEIESGHRLVCISTALTDACVEFDYPSSFLETDAVARATAHVTARDWVAVNVVRLRLQLEPQASFDFRCGQYLRVRVPGTDEWRSFSMATTPAELPRIELLVRVLPRGAMSDYLRERCGIDDQLDVEGPHGAFRWRESRSPHIMIAGGTGLAPMLGMLEQVRRLSGKRPPVVLSFGCASPHNLFYLDELQARAEWMPNLSVRVSVDQDETGYEGRVGNPVSAITPADITSPATVAYLCGPPLMIDAARAHLTALGVRPENILAEIFTPSAQSTDG